MCAPRRHVRTEAKRSVERVAVVEFRNVNGPHLEENLHDCARLVLIRRDCDGPRVVARGCAVRNAQLNVHGLGEPLWYEGDAAGGDIEQWVWVPTRSAWVSVAPVGRRACRVLLVALAHVARTSRRSATTALPVGICGAPRHARPCGCVSAAPRWHVCRWWDHVFLAHVVPARLCVDVALLLPRPHGCRKGGGLRVCSSAFSAVVGIDVAVDISGAVVAVDASGAVGVSTVGRILTGGHLEL
jgi:hypothetical protein